MKTNDETLIPPDLEQCQAYKPNGATALSLGAVPDMLRCDNPATVIATEKVPPPGLRDVGSMSLCDECLRVLITQYGSDYATVTALRPTTPTTEGGL